MAKHKKHHHRNVHLYPLQDLHGLLDHDLCGMFCLCLPKVQWNEDALIFLVIHQRFDGLERMPN